jgi:hypothetical protein
MSDKSKFAVYTAIFNDYDELMEPRVVEEQIDYICYTDNESLNSDTWEFRTLSSIDNPSLANRRIKILPHKYIPDYQISVYIDGNILIRGEITPLIKKYLSSADMAVYPHPKRKRVQEEAEACVRANKANQGAINAQMEAYKSEGFPDSQQLSENRILFRRHNVEDIITTMEDWWVEVSTRVPRDQLSLMFVLWKNNISVVYIPTTVQESNYFEIYPHKPDGILSYFWPYGVRIWASRDSSHTRKIIYCGAQSLWNAYKYISSALSS